ncbi:unnamed protein product [Ambrosiozyma monospora]|uniref:Protein BTN n=1 Tax=Ambrosiozyma monospora TaxID=43982 RepID=A0A9W6YXA9_AMBMO|nr:unnamed protein product [Ambrosiozyma monospora]
MSLKRVFAAFWIFGLVNNVLYVVILSAAVDLVGPKTPKAVVLMADILPSFICKLSAPFFIHNIPYNWRIFILVGLSFIGMLIVSFGGAVSLVICGITLASASSGLGETTFLQLTHYYDEISLTAWSSGTGGAGLVGSFLFMVMTTWLEVAPTNALLIFAMVPFVFFIIYFKLLPTPQIPQQNCLNGSRTDDLEGQEHLLSQNNSNESSWDHSMTLQPERNKSLFPNKNKESIWLHLKLTLKRMRAYVLPYMCPLFSVYVAEYIINQGISPTLLFDIDEMPFHNYRDVYVTYGTLYQLGVFISRSSGSFFRIKHLSIPPTLQMINMIICILQSLFMFIPNIWIIFVLILYEGLLGGSGYVNTYMNVTEFTQLEEREFAMGCVSISDSAGIVLAATISMFLEPALCQYQVKDGRPYCTLH